MCGIAGLWQTRGADEPALTALARRMADALAQRGPDDSGVWGDAACGLALGHRRLSVVDLSAEGHQPMPSASQRYVVSFNGEIYNYRDLRAELESVGAAPAWRGHSDTEVLLAAVEHWGLEDAVGRLTGMFAFALWDRHERRLHLARDRMGEKPLYYGWTGDIFAFGSELKALRALPHWQPEIDRAALAHYTRLGCVPSPYSIYRDILKLPPAAVVTLSARDVEVRRCPEPRAYWSLREVAESGVRQRFNLAGPAAADALDAVLRGAVARQMVADVPLGAFLSGGIDSSTVVALMQAQSARPVKTFSIGFHDAQYDEAPFAAAVARHLGSDHTELYVDAEQAMAVIPRLSDIYDEPFADSSQIPTFLVAQLARQHVTVSLSGDGGDELFAGYRRYLLGRKILRVPWPVRNLVSTVMQGLPAPWWDRWIARSAPLLPAAMHPTSAGDKVHKLGHLLAQADADTLYDAFVGLMPERDLVLGAEPLDGLRASAHLEDVSERMMFRDAVGYLPDDILVKVDRASMAVGLETRVPLLDPDVVAFAWSLPLSMKLRDGQGKWLLRQVLYRYVPRELIERRKMGFSAPLDAWLRGPLRDWAESLLDAGLLRRQGWFNSPPIRQKWQEHLSGTRNWQHVLWAVLMFQAWLQRISR